ncbi:MAG: hypothetical protein AABX86_02410 [Nanoarchaeota archaeon]
MIFSLLFLKEVERLSLLHRKGEGDLFEEIIPLLVSSVLTVIVIITVLGIANVGMAKDYQYYDVALEQYLQRLVNVCFAYYDSSHFVPGVLDVAKITPETVARCLQHDALGIKVILQGETRVQTDYYTYYAPSCVVEKKPYSCSTKSLRLLLHTSEGIRKTELVLEGVLHHD